MKHPWYIPYEQLQNLLEKLGTIFKFKGRFGGSGAPNPKPYTRSGAGCSMFDISSYEDPLFLKGVGFRAKG